MDQRQLNSGLKGRTAKLTESNKQLVKFGLIGVLAVLTDLCMYWTFLNVLPEKAFGGLVANEVLAKGMSFLCGLLVTYHFNKRWTWRKKDRSNRRLVKFILTYGISLILNVTINSGALKTLYSNELFAPLPSKYFIAFVIATGVCATFTFLAQKFWIFKGPVEV